MAEYLAYTTCGKTRPEPTMRKLYDVNVYTNFDCYGPFQNVAANFGRTIQDCNAPGSSDCQVLQKMIKKALTTDFIEEVIDEYKKRDAKSYRDLYESLKLMGMLKSWQYTIFDQRRESLPTGFSAQECIEKINEITKQNVRSTRPVEHRGMSSSEIKVNVQSPKHRGMSSSEIKLNIHGQNHGGISNIRVNGNPINHNDPDDLDDR